MSGQAAGGGAENFRIGMQGAMFDGLAISASDLLELSIHIRHCVFRPHNAHLISLPCRDESGVTLSYSQ